MNCQGIEPTRREPRRQGAHARALLAQLLRELPEISERLERLDPAAHGPIGDALAVDDSLRRLACLLRCFDRLHAPAEDVTRARADAWRAVPWMLELAQRAALQQGRDFASECAPRIELIGWNDAAADRAGGTELALGLGCAALELARAVQVPWRVERVGYRARFVPVLDSRAACDGALHDSHAACGRALHDSHAACDRALHDSHAACGRALHRAAARSRLEPWRCVLDRDQPSLAVDLRDRLPSRARAGR